MKYLLCVTATSGFLWLSRAYRQGRSCAFIYHRLVISCYRIVSVEEQAIVCSNLWQVSLNNWNFKKKFFYLKKKVSLIYQLPVNNSYDEAPCQLRASPPTEKWERHSNICHYACQWQVPNMCDGGRKREWPQRMHLAEVKHHTDAINKRTGTLATECIPCSLRDLLWQSVTYLPYAVAVWMIRLLKPLV